MSSTVRMTSSKMANVTGLVLFHHPYSYYSQKVLMVLHEKKIQFDSVIIDIIKGEQFSKDYLKINPRAEVPVLQDMGKTIPDSTRIIDYLEDNFSNGSSCQLVPKKDLHLKTTVLKFRSIIDSLPAGIITMGSFFHPELCDKPKLPFIRPVREVLKYAEVKSAEKLRLNAEINPEAKEVLLKKAEYQDKKHLVVTNKDEYLKILRSVDSVLDEVEQKLSSNGNQNTWLCCEDFTLADVSLTVLLVRLDSLGLDSYFWSNGKRKEIENYYSRVQQKTSFKRSIPNLVTHLKIFLTSQSKLSVTVEIVTVIGIVTGALFLVKRILF